MTPQEYKLRSAVADFLRMKAFGELRDRDHEDEVNSALEDLWLTLTSSEQLAVNEDLARAMQGTDPVARYRLFLATLARTGSLRSEAVRPATESTENLLESVSA